MVSRPLRQLGTRDVIAGRAAGLEKTRVKWLQVGGDLVASHSGYTTPESGTRARLGR